MFLNELVIHPFGVPFGFAGGQLDKVLLDRTAGCLHIHHDSSRSRRHHQRTIFHVCRFLTEDGPKETLFWRQLRLTLRRDFAD